MTKTFNKFALLFAIFFSSFIHASEEAKALSDHEKGKIEAKITARREAADKQAASKEIKKLTTINLNTSFKRADDISASTKTVYAAAKTLYQAFIKEGDTLTLEDQTGDLVAELKKTFNNEITADIVRAYNEKMCEIKMEDGGHLIKNIKLELISENQAIFGDNGCIIMIGEKKLELYDSLGQKVQDIESENFNKFVKDLTNKEISEFNYEIEDVFSKNDESTFSPMTAAQKGTTINQIVNGTVDNFLNSYKKNDTQSSNWSKVDKIAMFTLMGVALVAIIGMFVITLKQMPAKDKSINDNADEDNEDNDDEEEESEEEEEEEEEENTA